MATPPYDPNAVGYDGNPLGPDNGAPAAPAPPASGVRNPYAPTNAQVWGPIAANAAGGALSAYGNYQQSQQQLKQNALQFAATQAQNQFNADRTQKASNASGVLNGDPLGADQAFGQRNALLSAILPSLHIGTPSANGTGNISKMLSPINFDPAMVDANFGKQATINSIAQRHAELNNLDPNAPTPNLQAQFGSQAAPVEQNMQAYQQKLQTLDASQKAAFEAQMKAYTDQMVAQEQQQNDSGGFWHTFAKIAGAVGSIAAIALTGGAAAPILGPVLGTILGAGSAAVGAWGSGAGPGSALGAAIIGGAGPALKGAVGSR